MITQKTLSVLTKTNKNKAIIASSNVVLFVIIENNDTFDVHFENLTDIKDSAFDSKSETGFFNLQSAKERVKEITNNPNIEFTEFVKEK